MKILFIFVLTCFTSITFSQKSRRINLKVDPQRSSYWGGDRYKKTVDSAFIIATAVFNSPEFQSLFDTISFPYWNHCAVNECVPSLGSTSNERLKGSVILDSLFKENDVNMIICLKKKSRFALGSTCPKYSETNPIYQYRTTAYIRNIECDMRDVPLSYALAANLCHEYMYHIGFFHLSNSFNEPDRGQKPDPVGFQDDVAYRVGWQVYCLLKNWHENKTKIQGL